MSLRALALDWSLDGPVGTAFLVLVVAAGALYLTAAAHGRQHDRRRRQWPRRRTAMFLGGLAALVVDRYSGIGTEADVRLSVHMLEHIVMWVVVAPLLAAGAPVRLAFFAEGAIQREDMRTGFVERDKSAHEVRSMGLYAVLAPDARLAVKHRPADVVPQPLVVKYKFANRLRKLVTLPPALASPCCLALAFRRAGTCGLDRIGGRAEFVRGDVRNDPGLASSVSGMPCCPTQVSGRRHCIAGRRSSMGHLDLPTHPAASMLDRLTRS
jgi:hypothetical protein